MSTPPKKTDLAMHAPLPRRTVGGGVVASGAASPQLPPAGGRSPFAASFAASSPPHFPLHASGLMNAAAAAGGAGTTNASSTSSPFISAAVSSSSSSSLLGSPLSAGSSGGGSRIALLSQEENQELQRVGSGDGDDDEGPEEQEEDEEDGDTDGAFLALPPSAHPGGGASASLARSSSAHSLQMAGGSSGGNSGGGRGKRDVSVPLLATQVLPANVYVQQRVGSILSRGMILKADQFPNDNLRGGLDFHVIGAPNFQQLRDLAIYSTGQPSVSGIRTVLNLIHLKQNPRRRVQWINLREEPVIYLNNRPFVLRELEQPFHNMSDFQGIDPSRLGGIEERIKVDILNEAENNYGNILVHDEVEFGEIRACWTSVHESNVKTSSEIFGQLLREGFEVDLLRVPVTAESVFEAKQFDALIRVHRQALKSARQNKTETFFVINDQMGRGRSTIGMVAIYLLIKQHQLREGMLASPSSSALALPAPAAAAQSHPHAPEEHDGLSAYRRGDYDIMLRLQRLLREGKRAKALVDEAIDLCGRVHHLREQILESFVASEHARAETQHQIFSNVTAGYMKRYFLLVCFQAYLLEHAEEQLARAARAKLNPAELEEEDASPDWTFTAWWSLHPELAKLVSTLYVDESLLQVVPSAVPSSPEEMLAMQQKAAGAGTAAALVSPGGEGAAEPDSAADQQLCSVLDLAVFRRSGPVLSKRSILKSEFFHFHTRRQRQLKAEGRPNFRFYHSLPLAATAQPSVHGIRSILQLLAEVSRQRAQRIEDEAEALHSMALTGTAFDDHLRELVHAHSNAGPGRAPLKMMGHHSASAMNLNLGRTFSDASSNASGNGGAIIEEITPGQQQQQDGGNPGAAGEDGLFRPLLSRAVSEPAQACESSHPVLWINLREEPVLFVNQEPYLIRDYVHPFRVLTEFNSGMTRARTEQVEQGLKLDVLHELAESVGPAQASLLADQPHQGEHKIVVHEETASGQIRPRWEVVPTPLAAHVQTTAEVYASLKSEGYNLEYARVPLHVEEVPGLRSFDRLFELLNKRKLVDEKISVVFSCQKGGRRSTMGMVVCVLMLMHQRSVHYSIRSDIEGTAVGHHTAQQAAAHTLLTTEEKVAALGLSVARHADPLTGISEGEAVAQDRADLHGHTVSISAHPMLPTTAAATRSPSLHAVSSTADDLAVPAPSASPERQRSTGAAASSPTASQHAPPSMKKSHSSVAIHIEDVDRRSTRARFGRGEYKGILALIRILKQGALTKEEVDVAIDAVGGIVNIRDSIATAKTKADGERVQRGPGPRGGLHAKALKYLESYAYLICFNSYLRERRDVEEEARAAEVARLHAQQARQDEERKTKTAAEEEDEAVEAEADRRVQFTTVTAASPNNNEATSASVSAPPPKGRSTPPAATGSTGSGSSSGTFTFPSFSLWIQSRPELRKQLLDIHRDAEDALKLNTLSLCSGDEQWSGVYESRSGNVLVNGNILKMDWFKGSANPNIEQVIPGAINFRPMHGFPCAGTGIPSVQGIRGILDFFTNPVPAALGSKGDIRPAYQASRLLWFNLREEPLLYVCDQPFVLRDGDNPYVNIENTGINTRRLEAMERQLRRDVLHESERMRELGFDRAAPELPEGTEIKGGRVLLHDEDLNGNLIAVWQVNVNKSSIQTPQQQFLRCFEEVSAVVAKSSPSEHAASFTASYYRTPITDEQAPSSATLDDIIRSLETARDSPRPVIVWNCQMGRGRTTTGLIIGCLWCIHRGKVEGWGWGGGADDKSVAAAAGKKNNMTPQQSGRSILHSISVTPATTGGSGSLSAPPAVTSSPPAATPSAAASLLSASTSSTYLSPSSIPGDDDLSAASREAEFANGLKHGWYKVIQSLVRVLVDGPNVKKQVDRVIDHCGVFQNLREVVYETQLLCLTCLPRKKPFFVRRGTNYLIRYFMLICIGAYMSAEVGFDFSRRTFQQWLDERPEVQHILSTLQYPETMESAAPRKPPTGGAAATGRRTTSTITGAAGGSILSPNAIAQLQQMAQASAV